MTKHTNTILKNQHTKHRPDINNKHRNPKMAGKILQDQRTDKLRKTTNSRQTTDDEANNEEHKTEEDDLHTTGGTRNKIDDVTITPNQKIGKIQQIDNSRHTTDDNTSNQEQKKEELDSNPRPIKPTCGQDRD